MRNLKKLLFCKIKDIWNKLGEDIYRGENEDKKLLILRNVGVIFGFIMFFFVGLNHFQGRTVAEYACLVIAISIIAVCITIYVTRKRFLCSLFFTLITGVILTIFTLDGSNDGFAILWALLLPVSIMYFFDVKIGMIQSIYLELLFVLSFYTPIRSLYLTGKYTETFMNRWPILYGTAVIIFSAAMIQYHINTLKQYDYDDMLHAEIQKQTAKSETRRIMVEKLTDQMVEALTNAIDAKDTYTNGHSRRVEKYSEMIAKRSGLFSENELLSLRYTALLHDIGKIGVPDEIINKPSKLSNDEYDVIKMHPSVGGDILASIDAMPEIMVGARWHHERFDGMGYPDGLKGENIPLIARVITVADSYDAMTSNRSYRKYMDQPKVRQELVNGRGKQFDPVFADIMIQIIDEDKDFVLHE